jgi:hypothetical protein
MLHPMSWRGLRIADRKSCLAFARQELPTSYQRGLWHHLLRSLLHPTASSAAPILLKLLGAWLGESHMQWGAMIWNSILYHQDLGLSCEPEHCQVTVHSPQNIKRPDGSFSEYFFTIPFRIRLQTLSQHLPSQRTYLVAKYLLQAARSLPIPLRLHLR